MLPRPLLVATAFAVLLLAACERPSAEGPGEDGVFLVDQGDPDMDAAFRQAREGLDGFLATWRDPAPGFSDFGVKVGVTDDGQTEFFWITPFRETTDGFIGTISNTPTMVASVSRGSEISFPKSEIVDWMYYDQDLLVGNFTACAMVKKEPASERPALMQRYGLRCSGI